MEDSPFPLSKYILELWRGGSLPTGTIIGTICLQSQGPRSDLKVGLGLKSGEMDKNGDLGASPQKNF